jgi:hypothetical protein
VDCVSRPRIDFEFAFDICREAAGHLALAAGLKVESAQSFDLTIPQNASIDAQELMHSGEGY